MRRLLNPLQWNFGPRTTATLLTWAIVPACLAVFTVWRSLLEGAHTLGLTHEQIEVLTAGVFQDLLIVAVPLLVICIAAAVLFAWVIVQPLWRLRKTMEQITQGDLSQGPLPVHSQDEVGQITGSFNAMAHSLRSLVQELAVHAGELDRSGARLQESAGQTASATVASVEQIQQVRATAEGQAELATDGARAMKELSESSEQVATSAESQASEVERAATTVQEVAQAIDQVAASAGAVAEAAANTRSAADAGAGAVRAVVTSMEQLRERVLAAAGQVRDLSGNLGHVDAILALISEIANQTDLLALNAAIEAARVGEHGRGFAVVAGEVRRLAERSRRAAEEIGERVESIRSDASQVVITMEGGTQEVEKGALLARDAGAALDGILDTVVETQRQVEAISAASEEIAAASTQVVATTRHLSAIAEENATIAEEMLAGARQVSSLISQVEGVARTNQQSTGTMVAAAAQVRGAVDEMVACSSQVMATSERLREHVARFRLV